MADEGEARLQLGDDISLGTADVIAIKHQFEVWMIDGCDNLFCLCQAVEEISRRIVAVERFDQNRHATLLSLMACMGERCAKACLRCSS